MHRPLTGETIRIRGTVQGVGMRPCVWRIARELELRGRVRNDAEGVLIEAWGAPDRLDALVARLRAEAPPLARIERIERRPVEAEEAPAGFIITDSAQGRTATDVTPDAATCPACLAEIRSPLERRFGYPFTNCTHCGPRLSILRAVPYDRANTSMAAFPMCPRCRAEYQDPADRRFHAQPIACPDCGPRIWLEDAAGQTVAQENDAVLDQAAAWLRAGRILAIKGIGGIHLAVDARHPEAVAELRRRKRRDHKPFALMARDVAMVARHARLEPGAREALESPAAPIVILEAAGEPLAPAVAPEQHTLGFMLPYSPLHHLLMERLEGPIVLTSGNPVDAPQCIGNDEARAQLAGIADGFLLHDRDILTRLDDSVLHIAAGRPRLLRRARGFAPAPLSLPPGFEQAPPVLAMGAELKNTFCLAAQGRAIVSQHLGDLEDAQTLREYRAMLARYQALFDFRPAGVAVDRHPDYLSTQTGRAVAVEGDLPLVEVQHHHAHLAATLAEHGMPADTPPVLGLILDGIGLGADGTLWGGEFLLGDYGGFRHLAGFDPVPLPGGMRAMREPWRNAFAHLERAFGEDELRSRFGALDILAFFETRPLGPLRTMLGRGLNSPPASSAGRLFDAVAAVLGICRERISHEGQAAMQLEALAASAMPRAGADYPLVLEGRRIAWRPLWEALLRDCVNGVDKALVAARFHRSLAAGLARIALRLAGEQGTDAVALGGGVFHNRLLLEDLFAALKNTGLRLLAPERYPAGDGGLSLGQAVVAARRLIDGL